MSASVTVGAVVLFTERVEDCVAFYRTIGITLAEERHDEADPPHYACELGGSHFAIFPSSPGAAAGIGEGGCTFVGFAVAAVDDVVEAAARAAFTVLQPPVDYPWGRRAVLRDPDGRPVEVFERPE